MTPAIVKSLDAKLARLVADTSCRDFILADAKDADMGAGIAAPGPAEEHDGAGFKYRSLSDYRQQMREIARQGLIDIMLMSPSSSEILVGDERGFESSPVTPAVRANDSSDIWLAGSGSYCREPSRPFRSALVAELSSPYHGPGSPGWKVDLALYSLTFNNDAALDCNSLEQYRAFRGEAADQGLRHFLEVFAPNAPVRPIENTARFVNDSIARTLAGIGRRARPLFLKMPYLGPAAVEELRHYDSSLILGVLGGSAGTAHDAFALVEQAKRYGARAALFGRKILHAEDPLAFVRLLRNVADEEIKAAEAVRAYHAELERARVRPRRSMDDDLRLTDPMLAV